MAKTARTVINSVWRYWKRRWRGAVAAPLLLLFSTQRGMPQSMSQGEKIPEGPQRPEINWTYRWREDWSVLADTALRKDPFDPLKYIRFGADPKTYLSLGATIRERFESVSLILPPVLQHNSYLLDRAQLHADLHLGPYVRIFTQLVDARAPGKAVIGPPDQDRFDLEQAFLEVTIPAGTGAFDFTVGRQEPQFDLQRFADIRDGPNVRQPFNSVALGYSIRKWLITAFYSQPLETLDQKAFDDVSSSHFTMSGARLERSGLGGGKLSVFAAQLRNDDAFYLSAQGPERRNLLDIRYAGRLNGWDWDGEGMIQRGHVGAKDIRAWSAGGLFGYTWVNWRWMPRLGFQFDAASGTHDPKSGVTGTFNPLFPSGFYELLSGYPGYANFIHLKLAGMVHPIRTLSAMATGGLLWRETTADAVYSLPAIPVIGTAGAGSPYSGAYGQIRLDWAICAHLAAALDGEYFAHSESLRQKGAGDGAFIGAELRFGF
ncbi:MAG TPA: alginate export family protein [Puia sp.]|nr:alginate export family protein [Puia sp.]